jgi:hypothetical protein
MAKMNEEIINIEMESATRSDSSCGIKLLQPPTTDMEICEGRQNLQGGKISIQR